MIRVTLPQQGRPLPGVPGVGPPAGPGPVTQRSILDALEQRYPMLLGTIRDHSTKKRRPLVRFFACAEDITHDSPDAPLPEAIRSGQEPFMVIGAIAGG